MSWSTLCHPGRSEPLCSVDSLFSNRLCHQPHGPPGTDARAVGGRESQVALQRTHVCLACVPCVRERQELVTHTHTHTCTHTHTYTHTYTHTHDSGKWPCVNVNILTGTWITEFFFRMFFFLHRYMDHRMLNQEHSKNRIIILLLLFHSGTWITEC